MVFKYPNYVYTLPSNSDMYFGMIPESDRRPVKCPVCGNWFYMAYNTEDEDYAEEEMSLKGSEYIIHIKAKKKHFETYEYIKKDEFTCPFLLKPILIDPDSDNFNKDSLASYLHTHIRYDTIYPSKVLPDIFRKYSDMMELNGTTCKHCGSKYKLSYNKNGGKFSCSFGCECLSSEDMPDLCRLAVDFDYKYDHDYKYRHEPRKRVEHSKPSATKAPTKRSITKASPNPSTPVVESNYIISHMPNGYIVFN